MLRTLLSRLEVAIARLTASVRMLYYRIRLRQALRYLDLEGDFIGPACPHEVRIPLEVVRRLSVHERQMLTNALVDTARPAGCTIHECRRCYCLTRSTIKDTTVGY